MPSLGADMTEGTLLEWFVQPGDTVHRGDIVAVVDTSKSAIDIEVFEDGVVEQLLVEPGTTIDVGTPMAILAPVGATVEKPAEPAREPAACARAAPPEPRLLPSRRRRPPRLPSHPRPGRTCRPRRWPGGRRTSSAWTSPRSGAPAAAGR